MKKRKWIAALMVVVLLLQILPFSVLADGGVSTAKSSVKWVYLRPDSTKTDVHLEFVRVKIVSPSRIKVEAKGVYNVNLPPFAFSLNLHSAPFFGQCENYLPHFGPRVTCKIGLLPHILKNDTLKVFVVTSFFADSRYHIRFNASEWEETA